MLVSLFTNSTTALAYSLKRYRFLLKNSYSSSAGRGWAVPELVLNTRDVKGDREFVRRKRELMLGRLALK